MNTDPQRYREPRVRSRWDVYRTSRAVSIQRHLPTKQFHLRRRIVIHLGRRRFSLRSTACGARSAFARACSHVSPPNSTIRPSRAASGRRLLATATARGPCKGNRLAWRRSRPLSPTRLRQLFLACEPLGALVWNGLLYDYADSVRGRAGRPILAVTSAKLSSDSSCRSAPGSGPGGC